MIEIYQNERHKKIVESRGDRYTYIGSYHRNEVTLNGKNKKHNATYIRVKCPYCSKEYDIQLGSFDRGYNCASCCNSYENSFAYHIQQELGEPLNKYWDWEKNDLNPYCISKNTSQKIWIKCDKTDYHKSYFLRISSFYQGVRCPQCNKNSGKVHPKDSFGALYPEKAKYWSKNNKKLPYEVTPMSNKKYKFICEKCGKEFSRSIKSLNQNDTGVICNMCNSSKGETKIIRYLDKNDVIYIYDKPYFKDLLSDLGNPLRPDFILPNEKIWIEYDGAQHFEWRKWLMSEEEYKILQNNDKIKNEYAKQHDWKLVRIPYWEFDNIEEILEKELNKNN